MTLTAFNSGPCFFGVCFPHLPFREACLQVCASLLSSRTIEGRAWPGGGDQDEGRYDEEEDRDRPGDEDRVIPLGQGEGFPQAPFEHGAQNQGENGRGQGIVEFLEDIAQDAAEDHDADVEQVIVEAVGPDDAEDQDQDEKDVVGDLEELGPPAHQGKVQDKQNDVADVEAGDHRPDKGAHVA